jgi:outer membrane lipoprotein SlyB
MRKIPILICMLGVTLVSAAQGNRDSWANLSRLRVDQKIQVVEMTAKKHSGVFVSVSDSAISFKDAGGEQTVQKQDVRSVKLMKTNRRLRNTLIGTGVGAGVGAGLGAAIWESNGFLRGKGTGAAVGAVIGAVGGAIFGVLWDVHDTIYSVKSR